jgi:hypothetical protein
LRSGAAGEAYRWAPPTTRFLKSMLQTMRMNELVFTLEAQQFSAPDGVIWLDAISVRE